MMHCDLCGWGDGFSGNARVCGLALRGGEVVFIHDGLVKDRHCPMHSSKPRVEAGGQKYCSCVGTRSFIGGVCDKCSGQMPPAT